MAKVLMEEADDIKSVTVTVHPNAVNKVSINANLLKKQGNVVSGTLRFNVLQDIPSAQTNYLFAFDEHPADSTPYIGMVNDANTTNSTTRLFAIGGTGTTEGILALFGGYTLPAGFNVVLPISFIAAE